MPDERNTMPSVDGGFFTGSRSSVAGLNRQRWAQILGSAVVNGVTLYTWQEMTPYLQTLIPMTGGMSGGPDLNPVIEPNGVALTVGSFVKVRAAYFDSVYDMVYYAEGAESVTGGSASSGLELVNRGPGGNTIIDLACVALISDPRLVVTFLHESAGVDDLIVADASPGQAGVVNTGDQHFGGGKHFDNSLQTHSNLFLGDIACEITGDYPYHGGWLFITSQPFGGFAQAHITFQASPVKGPGNTYPAPVGGYASIDWISGGSSQLSAFLLNSTSQTQWTLGPNTFDLTGAANSTAYSANGTRGGWGKGDAGDTFVGGLWIHGGNQAAGFGGFGLFNGQNNGGLPIPYAAQAGTASSGSGVPTWVKVTKTFTDFAIANTNNTIPIYTLAAGGVILACKVKHSVQFSGGALTNYQLTAVAGTPTYFGATFEMDSVPTATNGKFIIGVGVTPQNIESQAAPTTINATVHSIGANLNAATQGSVDIWLLVSVAI